MVSGCHRTTKQATIDRLITYWGIKPEKAREIVAYWYEEKRKSHG